MEIQHFSVRQNNNLIVLTDLHVFTFGHGLKVHIFIGEKTCRNHVKIGVTSGHVHESILRPILRHAV